MREATLAASLVIDFLGYLERKGFALADVCRKAGVDPRIVEEPNSRVPAAYMERLWPLGEELAGDSDIGLHTAESYNPGALSIVGYVILSCRTAGEALVKLARYAPLLNEGLVVRVEQRKDETHCEFEAADHLDSFLHRDSRQVMETLAAGTVVTLQRLATAPVDAMGVTFRHASPASVGEHHRILGSNVKFRAKRDAVVYRTRTLEAPLVSADPSLLQVFELDANRRLEQLQTHGAVSGKIISLLGSRMRGEVPPLSAVASELAMSERSIQRSLREESTSYRQLVDEVRKDLALQHLSKPGATATDVAFMLGFSEPSAFTRAFRRWTGTAPTQFRSA